MRHARAEALDRLAPLLEQIRAAGVLREKTRGIFYLKSKAWLHFHEDPAGIFADIRGEHGDFDRLLLDDAGARDLLARIAALPDHRGR